MLYTDNWYNNALPSFGFGGSLLFNYNGSGSSESSIYDDLGAWEYVDNIIWANTFSAPGNAIPWNAASTYGFNFNQKIENDWSGAVTINVPTSGNKNSAGHIEINPVNGDIILQQAVINDNASPYQVWGANSKMLTIGADLVGGATGRSGVSLTIEQYSKVKLTAAQSWGGSSAGVNINQGEFWLDSGGSLASSSVPITVGLSDGNTAKLWLSVLTGGQTLANNITVNNQATAGEKDVGGLNTSGTSTFNGTLTLNGQVNLSSATGGTVAFGGIISGSSQNVVVNGYQLPFAGTIIMSAVNTYSGSTYISGGTLQFNSGGSAASSLNFYLGETSGSQTATLALGVTGGGQSLANPITVRSGSSGAKTISSLATTSSSTLGGAITLQDNLTVSSASGGNLSLSGIISGNSFGLTNMGAGTLTLSGANTYSGGLTVNGGTVNFASDGTSGGQPLGAYPGSTTAAAVTLNGGGLLDTTTATIASKRGLTLGASGGTLDASSGQTLTISSIIAGSGGLTKGANSGTLALSGANTYSGGLTVNGGTVSFASDGTSGGQPLGAYPSSTTAAAVTLNGGGLLDTTTATIAANRGISLGAGGSTLDAASGQTLTASSIIAGSGALTKGANGGTVSLNGVNTYSGATTINGGALTIGGSGQLGSGTYATNISDSGSLNYNSSAAQTLSGVISGAGTLTQSGSGTLTLSGANTYSGGTTVNAGILRVSGTLGSSSGALTASGGTLDLWLTSQTVGAVTIAGGTIQDGTLTGSSYAAQSGTVTAVLAGSGVALTKTTSGTLTLGGPPVSAGNTYNGLTTVSAGTLTLGMTTGTVGLNAFGGDLTINGGTVNYWSGSKYDNEIPDTANVTLSSGTLDFSARNEAIGQTSPSAAGSFTMSGGFMTISSGTVQLGRNPTISGGTITVTAAGGTLQANVDLTFKGGTMSFNAATGTGPTLNLRGGTGTGITYTSDGSSTATINNIGGSTPTLSLNTSGTTTFNIADAPSVDPELDIAVPITGVSTFTKTGAGKLRLSAISSYSKSFTISAGTLALGSSGAINSAPSISIAAGATFDVSAITSYTLSSSTTLSASGTGTSAGSTAAAINGGSTVSLGLQAVSLTFTPTAFTGDTTHPPLLISQGALTLSGNTITVNNAAATKLGVGTYRLIQVTGGTINGTPNATPTITGTGLATGTTGSISVSGGNVNLVVQNSTTTTLGTVTTPQTYGTVAFSATVSSSTATGTVTFKDGSATLGAGTLSGGTTTFTPTASQLTVAGSPHSITAVYGGDSSDAASTSSASTLNITVKALNYTGIGASGKVYDATTTASLSGTAATLSAEAAGPGTGTDGAPYTSDTVSFTTGTLAGAFASSGVGTGKAVTVTGGVTLTAGGQSANYSVGSPSTALTASITQKALKYTGISPSGGGTKVYDATTTASLSGTAATLTAEAAGSGSSSDGKPYTGDTVSFATGTVTGAYASSGVGSGIGVTVTGGLSLNNGNYSVGSPNTALTASITQKALTMSGLSVPSSKVYDGTTAATVSGSPGTLTGSESPGNGNTSDGKWYTGDTVSIAGTVTGTYNSKDVASAITVTYGGLSLSGAQAGDYSLTIQSAAAATITQAITTNIFTSSPNPSLPGSGVTFTATIANAVPGGPAPAGSVQFKTNGVALCDPVVLDGSGVASFATNSLPHGSNTVTAEFAGDSNFLGLTNSVVQIVNTPPSAPTTSAGIAQNQALVYSGVKLLTICHDPDGDTLSITSAGPTSTNGGTVTLAGGNITYQPVTSFVGTDLFSFLVSDPYGAAGTGTVLVTVSSISLPSANVVIPPAYDSGSGTFRVTFAGIPNYTYSIQSAPTATGTWSFLKTATAGTDGMFEVTDTQASPPPARYYRTVYP